MHRPATSALEVVRKTWSSIVGAGGLDSRILSKLRVVEACHHKGTVLCELTVEDYHLNRLQGLHGGTICTLVDIGGSLAVAAKANNTYTGVSTDISVSFLNGGKIGDKLQIHSTCNKKGKTLAYTTVEVKAGDKLLATGSHTKYVGGTPKVET
ncbi:uncharacterized protein SPPG_09477 [Spizellomyces punctatus DAOM BR117]|uniref:Thioesterase domain-containing protein n=1 Tax=Spizellomyces punctatus (strain DAOM BR117) TaxID=645134 RepID=A0A0L0H919_SPIPD|nr:uncharacterized protein SPPG_09477 [Spizellomyces punctatus DAOM BR117]KNC97148.1 hypothetical protein SPPG_09477 [Spizellomyces punctatus DAOM BR117]|eukprot:XP_016605188.1 hypothetical protein SPPG_09477 [Spizellomyces punctatus DAOM BR117]